MLHHLVERNFAYKNLSEQLVHPWILLAVQSCHQVCLATLLPWVNLITFTIKIECAHNLLLGTNGDFALEILLADPLNFHFLQADAATFREPLVAHHPAQVAYPL